MEDHDERRPMPPMTTTDRKPDSHFRRQLEGWSLATAEIYYRMPDARSVLQTFVWQDYDLAPKFPQLRKFLDFWQRELDGPLHSVRLCHAQLLRPAEVRVIGKDIAIH
jgi:uncharacterized protein Usg